MLSSEKRKIAVASTQAWRKKNPSKARETEKIFRSTRAYKIRANQYKREYEAKRRFIILSHYSKGIPRCNCCGESNYIFLAIDHVNNDGAKHRKDNKLNYSSKLHKWIFDHNFPTILQVLCHNCNLGKQLNKGICPHKTYGIE